MILRLCLLAAAFLLWSFAHAKDAAHVNGEAISLGMLTLLSDSRTQGPLSGLQQDEHALLEDLITTELLSQAARSAGVDEVPRNKLELELAQKTLLSQLYVMDYMARLNISEEQLREAYDAIPARVMVQMQRWNFADAASAKAFLRSAMSGNLAKELAGQTEPWQALDAFAFGNTQQARDIKAGQWLPEPVEEAGTWTVWRCLERSEIAKPVFEVAREGLLQEISQQQLQQHIAQLREQATIKTFLKD